MHAEKQRRPRFMKTKDGFRRDKPDGTAVFQAGFPLSFSFLVDLSAAFFSLDRRFLEQIGLLLRKIKYK